MRRLLSVFGSRKVSKNARHWSGILVTLGLSVFSVSQLDTSLLLSSVSSIPTQDPFDGTVMPIQKVPDWSNLASGEDDYSYSQLSSSKFIDIPEYDNDVFETSSADLGWSSSDVKIRNAKITYPVPYAGNYELDDCGEGCGSHPAVDIKALRDTPVYAIANGIIEEAGTSSGWGNYVVIKHTGVPDPDNSKKTTTLYSSYSHLVQLFVTDGQKISKGEILGEVGDTGTATTYHLHFQIDNDDAPWYPYWPFTTAEASAAGYDFWDAVNYGVGQDNLYDYTENPLDYVQKYLDEDAVLDDSNDSDDSNDDDQDEGSQDEPDKNQNNNDDEEEVSPTLISGVDFASIGIEVPAVLAVGEQETIRFTLLDSESDVVESDAEFTDSITVTVSDSSLGTLNRSSLDRYAFDDGEATLRLYGDHSGMISVTASYKGNEFSSASFEIVDEIGDYDHLEIVHDGSFNLDKEETIEVRAVDSAGVPVTVFEHFGTINLSLVQGKGKLSTDHLRNDDFVKGIAKFTFTGSSDDSVIFKFTYGLEQGNSSPMEARLFNDLGEGDSSFEAVSYLYKQGTVEGYADGSFQPTRTVSRVESLMFIFSGLEQPVNKKLKISFSDTSASEWYGAYLATAHSLGVVEGYSDGSFKPAQGVNRVEFLKMLFTIVELDIDPVVVNDPYKDVNNLSWFAPYVSYSKEKNLFPVTSDSFEPSKPMSRLEVAEVIYRLITVLDNQEDPYSTLQKPK